MSINADRSRAAPPRSQLAATWRGKIVHPALAMWFDQLMSLQPLVVSEHAENCYMDVQLTATQGGGSAASPQITFKPAVAEDHGRRYR